MKIVLIDKENKGGISVYNKRLIQFLQKKGHTVATIRFGNKPQMTDDLIFIPQYIDPEQTTFTFLPSEKTLQIIKKTLLQIKPDLVYTCIGLSPFDFFLPSLCHKLNIPIAGVWHTDLNKKSDLYQIIFKSIFSIYLPFCKQLDLLHVFSKKLKKFYVQKGLSARKIVVIPNGVDAHVYMPGPSNFAKKHNVKTGILFLGRLTFQKNPELLIKSFLACHTDISVKLIIVGAGDLQEKLQEKYIDERIIFTGEILSEKEKIDIIRSCQIFVLPSRFEGISLALLEAMSCGLACIVSEAGSSAEVVEDGGIRLPVHSGQKNLVSSLKDLLNNPTKTKRLGEHARQAAITHYNEETIFTNLLTRFQQFAA